MNRWLRIKESSSVFRRLLGRMVAQIIILERACLFLPGNTVFLDRRLKGKRKGEKKGVRTR